MTFLRRLFRRRRDPHSLDPVRPMVRPEDRYAQALERRRATLDYVPENAFHRDRKQEPLPCLLRRQAS